MHIILSITRTNLANVSLTATIKSVQVVIILTNIMGMTRTRRQRRSPKFEKVEVPPTLKSHDTRYSSSDSDLDSKWDECIPVTVSGIFARSNSTKIKIKLANIFVKTKQVKSNKFYIILILLQLCQSSFKIH